MSARARPLLAFKVVMTERQVVMSEVERRVVRMRLMSEGCGEAMHS